MLGVPGPRLMAVNGDEGEPGTIKDRYFLESDPHRVLEGMLIGAHVVAATDIYFYVRDEYQAALVVLRRELDKLKAAGLTDGLNIHLRRGAGAYICGEESAMIESIEGKRGLPRHKPPLPFQVGIFGRPTLINNVETLYWIRDLVERGPHWWLDQGRNGRKGLHTYSVSGRVAKSRRQDRAGRRHHPRTDRRVLRRHAARPRSSRPICRAAPRAASCPRRSATSRWISARWSRTAAFIGSAAVVVLSDQDDMREARAQRHAVLRGRKLRPMHAVPGRAREKAARLMAQKDWDTELLSELRRRCATPRSAAWARRRPIRC